MRVELDEPRHHRQSRRIDHLAAGVIRVRMRNDRGDLVSFDRDVDVRPNLGAFHVDEPARMNDNMGRRNIRRVLQIERHRARFARLDVDDPQLVERLIQDVSRIARPARRVRALARDVARRTERLARHGDRPDGENAFVDCRHLRPVRRPHRSAPSARVDRECWDRGVPLVLRPGRRGPFRPAIGVGPAIAPLRGPRHI